MSNAVSFKTHQNAPQAQIGDEAMADAVELVKTLETPYLRDLRRLIDTEILARANTERRDAILKIQSIAHGLGLSVAELVSGATPKDRKANSNTGKKHGPSVMKYQHPADPTRQWSGRGLAPKWVKEWEETNGSRDGLLIVKA